LTRIDLYRLLSTATMITVLTEVIIQVRGAPPQMFYVFRLYFLEKF